MCAMLNIWDDCSSDEEEKVPVKIEIEKSITVKVGDVPEDEDEQLQLAIQKSLADQEEQWYYSSEEKVNEVGVQSLTRSGRVYNPESSVQAKGKEIVADGIKKKMIEKDGENPKEKKSEEELVKGCNGSMVEVWVGSYKEGLSLSHRHLGSKTSAYWDILRTEKRRSMRSSLLLEG
ncbi:hypothetical protein JCGZ_18397 [Jatropha curcas]|uniref:Uncharacterized protein n=2 Tax=Jatropha curcas TaxID=180498 RepID=A0A067KE25_JATCU|nr:hypothetical protein JCGZ_18397 [Jatropha curcas]